ncbi:hypothetical protein Gohar_008007, partial [Gossypium harknessii]|nr:hypothetical protein [Gossypium harknessii]
NLVRSFPKDTKSGSPSIFPELPYNLRGGGGSGGAAGASSVDTARVLVSRPPRYIIHRKLFRCGRVQNSVDFASSPESSSVTPSNAVYGAGLPSFSSD